MITLVNVASKFSHSLVQNFSKRREPKISTVKVMSHIKKSQDSQIGVNRSRHSSNTSAYLRLGYIVSNFKSADALDFSSYTILNYFSTAVEKRKIKTRIKWRI